MEGGGWRVEKPQPSRQGQGASGAGRPLLNPSYILLAAALPLSRRQLFEWRRLGLNAAGLGRAGELQKPALRGCKVGIGKSKLWQRLNASCRYASLCLSRLWE